MEGYQMFIMTEKIYSSQFLRRFQLYVIILSSFQLKVIHFNVDLPKELEICAWSNGILDQEPIIMGLKHKSRPIWTVQFHPEVIIL